MSTHQEIYKWFTSNPKWVKAQSHWTLHKLSAQKKKILNPPEETVPKSHQKQQRSKNAEARVQIQS